MSKSSISDKEARSFRNKYLKNISPTGYEVSGQRIWGNYVSKFMGPEDKFIGDKSYGSIAAVIKGSNSNFKVVLDAHADEISWRILHIEEDGQIGVMRNGGSDSRVAPGSFVNIQSKKGQVKAVFGSPAIHVRHDSDKKEAKDEELRVDMGAHNKQEVLDKGVDVGMTVVYATDFEELFGGRYLAGRAMDDRICGYINSQVIRRVKEENITLNCDLYVVNAVQEETGLRGASLMANIIQPNVAIALDVCHDTKTKGYSKDKQGDLACDKGPVITYGAALHNNVVDLMVDTAKKNNIAIQKTSTGYSSGTDTDAYAYQGKGCPSALISLPLKYMHTAVEMVSVKDIDNVIDLVVKTLQEISGDSAQFDYLANDIDNWNQALKNKPT